jgi:hypothetical protein
MGEKNNQSSRAQREPIALRFSIGARVDAGATGPALGSFRF